MHFYEKFRRVLDIQDFLKEFKCLDFGFLEIQKAYQIWGNKDFEDALQIAIFLESKCDKFITLDKNLAKKYSQVADVLAL